MVDLNEETEECVVKVVGIFWDIENCRIPKNISVEGVVQSIKKSANIGSVDHKLDVFCCSCHRLSNSKTKRLNALKVDILLVSSDRNSADNKLIDKMIDFLDNENHLNKRKLLVLISGDSDFVPFLKTKICDPTEVVVIYWNNCSLQLFKDFKCIKLEFNSLRKGFRFLKHNTKHKNENPMNSSDNQIKDRMNGKTPVLIVESEDEDVVSPQCEQLSDLCCMLCSCVIF